MNKPAPVAMPALFHHLRACLQWLCCKPCSEVQERDCRSWCRGNAVSSRRISADPDRRRQYDGDPVYRAVADRAPAATVIIPPRATAVVSEVSAAGTPTPRDRHIEMIAAKGRLGWQKAVGYGRRPLVETGILRYKTIIGRTLRARTLPAEKVEARVGCKVLNRMTALGMPVSRRLA